MKKWFFLPVITLLLSACATVENYEKKLASWVGSSADNLVMNWGPPARSFPLSNGGRVLEYRNQRTFQTGGRVRTVPQVTEHSGNVSTYGTRGSGTTSYQGTSTTYVEERTPIQTHVKQCITRFTVNSQGVITHWAWQGDDCTSD